MGKELSKTYNPAEVEDAWYAAWEQSGAFKPDDDDNESFTLMIPPPNVTGILTMGHVLNNSIQDVLVRRARMLGKNTLWLPGTDHASIATEAKVTRMLKEENINRDLDKFYTHPEISKRFVENIKSHVSFDDMDIILEPSAGSYSLELRSQSATCLS